jgi:hypothetical protein
MEDFINYYKTNYKIKSEYSVSNAVSSIKRIEKIVGKPIDLMTDIDFKDSEKLILKLNAMYSYNTSILTLNTLINYLKYCKAPDIDIYKVYLNDYIELRGVWDTENAKVSLPFTFTELRQKVMDKYPEMIRKPHAFTKYRNYLLVAILTLGLPLRLHSFINMRVCLYKPPTTATQEEEPNYIVKTPEGEFYFILRTNKKRVIYKPDNQILQRLLTNYFSCYSKHTQYFLTNSKGEIMSQTNMTNALTSASNLVKTNTTLTFNFIRKIFLREFFEKEKTHKERKKILEIIGQTYN